MYQCQCVSKYTKYIDTLTAGNGNKKKNFVSQPLTLNVEIRHHISECRRRLMEVIFIILNNVSINVLEYNIQIIIRLHANSLKLELEFFNI